MIIDSGLLHILHNIAQYAIVIATDEKQTSDENRHRVRVCKSGRGISYGLFFFDIDNYSTDDITAPAISL